MSFKEKLIMLREKLKFLNKREEQVSVYQQVTEEEPIHEFDIVIENSDDIIKILISDYITMSEYFERIKEVDKNNVTLMLSNAIIWSGSKQRIYKGEYYIFRHNGRLYNIRKSDNEVQIDERTFIGDGHVWEKIFTYKVNEKKCFYSSLKHDETGNTYYTMYYDVNESLIEGLDLSRDEFLNQVNDMIGSLSEFLNIIDIIDLELLRKSIDEGVTLIKK